MQKYIPHDHDFALELFSNCTCLDRMGILLSIGTIYSPSLIYRLTVTEISYANAVCQKNYRNEDMIRLRDNSLTRLNMIRVLLVKQCSHAITLPLLRKNIKQTDD